MIWIAQERIQSTAKKNMAARNTITNTITVVMPVIGCSKRWACTESRQRAEEKEGRSTER